MPNRIYVAVRELRNSRELLTRKQLAEILQVSTMTVYNYGKRGLKCIKLPGGTVRYEPETVYNWWKDIENHTFID